MEIYINKTVSDFTLLNDFHTLMLYRRLPVNGNENAYKKTCHLVSLEEENSSDEMKRIINEKR